MPAGIVLVADRFWPLAGRGITTLTALARRWAAEEPVTILTWRWGPGWPAELEFHGARLLRIEPPRPGFWSWLSTESRLAEWIESRAAGARLIYAAGLGREARAACRAGRRAGVPVVLRCDELPSPTAAPTGHWARWPGATQRRRLMGARAVVVPTEILERRLTADGWPGECLRRIPYGVEAAGSPGPARRTEARLALAETNPAWALESTTPLVVAVGGWRRGAGWETLVEAWPRVVARLPGARLWLVGDGPARAELLDQAAGPQAIPGLLLTGVVDDLEDLLAAAHVVACPWNDEAPRLSTLEALASGRAVVAADTAAHRSVLADGAEGRLLPGGDAAAWAECLVELLTRPELATALGAAAARRVAAEYPAEAAVERHRALFDSVAPRRVP